MGNVGDWKRGKKIPTLAEKLHFDANPSVFRTSTSVGFKRLYCPHFEEQHHCNKEGKTTKGIRYSYQRAGSISALNTAGVYEPYNLGQVNSVHFITVRMRTQ